MPTTPDPAAAAQALGNVLAATSQGTVDTMRIMAGDHDARARRHAAIAERLAATLGEKDDRVLALRKSSDLSHRFAQDLTRAASKIAPDRLPQPGSLTFTGRVTDATGTVLPGLHARLSDRRGAVRIPASDVTDELGNFLLVVPANAIEPDTELFLTVEDASGRVVQVSPEPMRFEVGVLQRVDLVVELKPPPDTAPTPIPGPRPRTSQRAARKPSKSRR